MTSALNSYFYFQVEMSLSGKAWAEGKDSTLRSFKTVVVKRVRPERSSTDPSLHGRPEFMLFR